MGGHLSSRLQNKDDRLTRVMWMPRIRYVENPGRSFCPVCYWAKGKGIQCTKDGVCYKLECIQCRNQDTPILTLYIGETSRSGREQVIEHIWLFKHRKQGCPDFCTKRHKCSSNSSTLWEHSREKHRGQLRIKDWEVKLTYSHRGALNRQEIKACRKCCISNEGLVSLLNKKNEYGGNSLT